MFGFVNETFLVGASDVDLAGEEEFIGEVGVVNVGFDQLPDFDGAVIIYQIFVVREFAGAAEAAGGAVENDGVFGVEAGGFFFGSFGGIFAAFEVKEFLLDFENFAKSLAFESREADVDIMIIAGLAEFAGDSLLTTFGDTFVDFFVAGHFAGEGGDFVVFINGGAISVRAEFVNEDFLEFKAGEVTVSGCTFDGEFDFASEVVNRAVFNLVVHDGAVLSGVLTDFFADDFCGDFASLGGGEFIFVFGDVAEKLFAKKFVNDGRELFDSFWLGAEAVGGFVAEVTDFFKQGFIGFSVVVGEVFGLDFSEFVS